MGVLYVEKNIEVVKSEKDRGEEPLESNSTIIDNGEGCKDYYMPTLLETSFDDIRELSKRQIELFEHWSRRLIDEIFRDNYGNDYINTEVNVGQPLVKNEVRKRIEERKVDNPRRFPRDIDAILIEDIQYFITRQDLYKNHFKNVFESFYSGDEEIRSMLDRLIDIRNRLYHDNPISIRDAERVLCYTNDFIDVIKDYYMKLGKERDFNVPTIISITDSQGNASYRRDSAYTWEIKNVGKELIERHKKYYHDAITTSHRSGETYEIELEVDESFEPNSYSITWIMTLNYKRIMEGTGRKIFIRFTDEMVSYEPKIIVKLKTNKEWHRFAYINCDD